MGEEKWVTGLGALDEEMLWRMGPRQDWPVHAKRCDGKARGPIDAQVRQNAPDHARVLVGMAGAEGERNVRIAGQQIHHKVTVWR